MHLNFQKLIYYTSYFPSNCSQCFWGFYSVLFFLAYPIVFVILQLSEILIFSYHSNYLLLCIILCFFVTSIFLRFFVRHYQLRLSAGVSLKSHNSSGNCQTKRRNLQQVSNRAPITSFEPHYSTPALNKQHNWLGHCFISLLLLTLVISLFGSINVEILTIISEAILTYLGWWYLLLITYS